MGRVRRGRAIAKPAACAEIGFAGSVAPGAASFPDSDKARQASGSEGFWACGPALAGSPPPSIYKIPTSGHYRFLLNPLSQITGQITGRTGAVQTGPRSGQRHKRLPPPKRRSCCQGLAAAQACDCAGERTFPEDRSGSKTDICQPDPDIFVSPQPAIDGRKDTLRLARKGRAPKAVEFSGGNTRRGARLRHQRRLHSETRRYTARGPAPYSEPTSAWHL